MFLILLLFMFIHLFLFFRIFKGNIALLTFLCLPQKAIFFICAFALYLRGLYSFSSGYKIIYEVPTCLFTFILLQIRVD